VSKFALITVHGMGETEDDYYKPFLKCLEKKLSKAQKSNIVYGHVYYQGILQHNEENVFERMRSHIDWMKLRKFLLYGLSDAASLESNKQNTHSPYVVSQEHIKTVLEDVFDAAGGPVPVYIIAHSLGGQVISNYIWDACRSTPAKVGYWVAQPSNIVKNSDKDNFIRLRTLKALFTTGCNIPIFVSGHNNIQAFPPPNNEFKWLNYFDEDDVLGWPLKPLSASYEALVKDYSINAGNGLSSLIKSWNPMSHTEYWEDRFIVKEVCKRLA